MSLYVYVTPECDEDILTHGQKEAVSRFRDKVERDQHAGIFDRFLPTPFLKKPFGKSYRLLAYETFVGRDQVICFIRFLARGGNGEYEHVFKALEDPPAQIARIIPNEAQLLAYLENRRNLGTAVAVIPVPSLVELAWLEAGPVFAKPFKRRCHRVRDEGMGTVCSRYSRTSRLFARVGVEP